MGAVGADRPEVAVSGEVSQSTARFGDASGARRAGASARTALVKGISDVYS